MLKVSLVLLAITTAAYCLSPRPAHNYWFMSESPREVGDDSRWGYCDLKCLYLQHYHPNLDFVVLILTAPLRDPFAACYVKTINGFTLWSKVVKNEFYETYCGKDYKDWAHMDLFSIKAVYGDGRSTQIRQEGTYNPQ